MRFSQHKSPVITVFWLFLLNRWLKTLEKAKYSRKYDLKISKDFKGGDLKSSRFLVVMLLKEVGIKDEKDQQDVFKHVENMIKQNKKKKKKSKKRSYEADSKQDPNPNSGSETDDGLYPVSDDSTDSDD